MSRDDRAAAGRVRRRRCGRRACRRNCATTPRGASSTSSATAWPPRRNVPPAAVGALVAGVGRHRPRDGDRHRRPAARAERGAAERHPRALARLRRHAPAVGAAPVGVGGPGRARRRGVPRRDRGPAARRDRRRRRDHRPARHGGLRRGTGQLGVLRARPARDVDLRRPRRGGGRGDAVRCGRRGDRRRDRHRGQHGLGPAGGQPHRRHGEADPLRLGRPRAR